MEVMLLLAVLGGLFAPPAAAASPAPTPGVVAATPPAPAGAPAGTARLALRIPGDALRSGRANAVLIVRTDASGAVAAPDEGIAPVLTADGAKAGPVASVAPGLWTVDVTPAAPGPVRLRVVAGPESAERTIEAQTPPVVSLALSHPVLRPEQPARVTATVEVKDGNGRPIDAPVVIESTSGKVPAPTKVGPGKWTARIPVPAKRHPQGVLVAAYLAEGDADPAVAAFTVLGRAAVPITTKPRSRITVRVAGKSFGPFTADGYGEATAEVIAGPASTSMEVESVDDVGNRSLRTLPLAPPPFARVWTRVQAGQPWIDGKTDVAIAAAALARDGSLLEGGTFEATVAGRTVVLESRGGGVRVARARPAFAAGAQKVAVRTPAGEASSSIKAGAPPAVAVRLSTGTPTVSALGVPTGVEAVLVDAAGQPVRAGSVALSAEGLAIGGLQNAAGAVAGKVSLVKGAGLDAPPTVTARANVGDLVLAARASLPVVSGPPAKAEFLSQLAPMLADGETTAEIAARITDAEGYPVTGLKPTVAATAGEVALLKAEDDGTYRFRLRAPQASGSGKATLVLNEGTARAHADVTFLRPPARRAVAAGFGAQHNLGALSQATGWLEGRHGLGGGDAWMITTRVVGKRGSFSVNRGTAPIDVTVTQALGLIGVRRRFGPAISRWAFHGGIGAGGGVAQVAQSSGFTSGGTVFAARGSVTAERKLGGGALLLETGYEWSTASDRTLIRGPLAGVEITMGYRHGF